MTDKWYAEAAEWDAGTLENYIFCARLHVEELQKKAAFAHERLTEQRQARSYLDWPEYQPEVDEDYPWGFEGDLRKSDDDDNNYDCADALSPLFPDVVIDPESSCFYAYAKTEERIRELALAVQSWMTKQVA